MSGNSIPRRDTTSVGGAGEKQRADNSLRGKALDRALGATPPKTLTPWEWEQWYDKHGMPPTFSGAQQSSDMTVWQRLKQLLERRH